MKFIPDPRLPPGSRIVFLRGDGQLRDDITRTPVFEQSALLMPYAPNTLRPAVVLTAHSWCYVDDIKEVNGEVWP